MIKTLRRKFILTSMTAITLVLLVIIATINIANYSNMKKNLDVRLDIIIDNDGGFPEGTKPDKNKFEGNKLDDNRQEGINGEVDSHRNDLRDNPAGFEPPKNDMKFRIGGKGFSDEAPFDTRFFIVRLNDAGEMAAVDVDMIATVTADEAIDTARDLFLKNKKSGFYGKYRYKSSIDREGNHMYVFINGEREISAFYGFLIASIVISLIGLVLFLILVILFSRIVMKPVIEGYEKQKRFITDASHEIKTPLSIIAANTEVIEMDAGESEWTKSTINQVGRLKELTEKLVFLSKLDEGTVDVPMVLFNISNAVREESEIFAPIAVSVNKNIDLDIADGLFVNGNEDSIRRLVNIMLDNAMKYSIENDIIKVKLFKDGKQVRIRFSNKAKDLPEGNLDKLFERFYRVDASRNQKTGGHGIGLSMAEAIVMMHNGKINAGSDGESIEFNILLPMK